jgi:long-chain acyl-CoA synthetase
MNFIDYLFDKKEDSEDVALISDTGELSYSQLHRSICNISGWIQGFYGVNNNFILIADNSFFFVSVYFGIIHSGNRVVLVDPKTSYQDILTIIQQCNASIIFADLNREQLSDLGCPLIFPGDIENLPISEGISSHGGDQDCAVIIFTSGSTGTKKGVMLSHQNLIANTSSIVQYLQISEKDRICVVLPFFYCFGASLLHTHVRAGGSVVLAQSIFLGSVIHTLDKYQCTGFAGVPSTYLILKHKTPFLSKPFPSLRFFQQAGGHLAPEVVQELISAFPDKQFYVMYGATEATARLSYLPPSDQARKPGSIGKGIPGVTLDVYDDEGQPVPLGKCGEIVARGENIMLGYYNDPEETKRVLRNGWYHTGDLGKIDEDGYIYVTGRIGTFIKSGGFKVSPVEIEDTIQKLPDAYGCVVIGIPHYLMGEAIIACIQSQNPTNEFKHQVLEHCRRELPTHKIPVDIVFVDEIPLNSSGKSDRRALIAHVQNILNQNPS